MEKLTVSNFVFEEHTGRVYFEAQLPEDSTQHSFYLINHDVPKYVPPIKIPIQSWLMVDNRLATVEFNLDELFLSEDISDDSSWYLIYESETEQYECNVEKGNYNYFFLRGKNLYKIKPYLTKYSSIAFYIRAIEVSIQANNLQYSNGTLKGDLDLTIENFDNNSVKISLGIKERGRDTIQEFDCISPAVPGMDNYHFALALTSKLNKLHGNESLFDIYLVLESRNCKIQQKLMVDQDYTHQFEYFSSEVNEFFLIKPYSNNENALTLYVKKQNIIPILSDVIFDEFTSQMSIEGVLSVSDDENNSRKYEAIGCVLKQRNPVGETHTYYVEKTIPLDITGNIFSGSFILEEVFPVQKAFVNNEWDVFVTIRGEYGSLEDYPVTMINTYESKNYGYYTFDSKKDPKKIKPYITGLNGLSLYVSDSDNKNDTLKIAILGNSYSCAPFNSNAYFNPQYKNLYQVVFTQSHSSLISLISDPAILPEKDVRNVESSLLPFIKRDFNKTFFDDLKNTSPDYFILDFDTDVTYDLVKISEGQIVTLSNALATTSYLCNHQGQLKYINHNNNEEYLELWKKSLDTFISRLITIIPPERVILTSGRYAEKYLDSNKKVQHFQDMNLITERNKLWEEMDYYFLSKLPEANYIKLTNTRFIGDASYPLGNTPDPSYYQSGYYKEFLRQLNEIVIRNK